MKKFTPTLAVVLSLVVAFCNVLAVFTVSAAETTYLTFTVTLYDNADGTADLTATIPDGIKSGKIVVKPSDRLEYIDESLKSGIVSAGINPAYNKDGVSGLCVSFADAEFLPEGATAMKASFKIVNNAPISEADVDAPLWNLSEGNIRLSGEEDGDVNKVFVPARTVTFLDWNGDVLKTMKVRHGSAAAAPAEPTGKPHWHFVRWDKAFDNITADTNVTAVYEIDSCTVTFVSGGHGSFEGATTATVDYGAATDSIARPTPVPDSGYIFHKWSDAPETVTSDMEISASFALLGDVNEDGAPDNIDASLILRYDAGNIEFSEFQLLVGDVNLSDEVDNLDAVLVLQLDAGLIENF